MGVYKINKSWWVDFRFARTRYRKRSPINSREGSKDYEALLRQKLARGEGIDEEKKQTQEIFSKFAWHWFDVYVKNNNKHSEIISKESILRVHLVPYFGKFSLEQIDNQLVEKYKQEKMKTKLKSKSINNHLTVLKKCLETACEWKLLKNTPRIKLLKTPPQKFDYLTIHECEMILNNSIDDLKDMIILGLNTGLRFGEIIALSWEDVDLNKRMLSINKSISKGLLGSTKSNKNRYIPMSPPAYEMLRSREKKNGFVFTNIKGDALEQVKYCKLLHRACERANMRKIGWHTLRHTFASHLAQKNISIKAVQELLGHSDIKTTMRYAHLGISELRSAVEILNFGQPVVNESNFSLKLPTPQNLEQSILYLKLNKKQSF